MIHETPTLSGDLSFTETHLSIYWKPSVFLANAVVLNFWDLWPGCINCNCPQKLKSDITGAEDFESKNNMSLIVFCRLSDNRNSMLRNCALSRSLLGVTRLLDGWFGLWTEPIRTMVLLDPLKPHRDDVAKDWINGILFLTSFG